MVTFGQQSLRDDFLPLFLQLQALQSPLDTMPWPVMAGKHITLVGHDPTISSWSSRLLNGSFEGVHQPMYLILIPNSPSIELARIASRHAFWSSTVAGTKSAGISPSPNRRGIQTNQIAYHAKQSNYFVACTKLYMSRVARHFNNSF